MGNFSLYTKISEKDIDAQGRMPIWIALSINRRTKYKQTPYRVTEEQWDKQAAQVQKHPNAKIINGAIKKQLDNIDSTLTKLDYLGEPLNHDVLKSSTFEGLMETRRIIKTVDFEQYALVVKGVKNKTLVETELNKIKRFTAGKLPDLKEITVSWLRSYQFWLQSEPYGYHYRTNEPKYYAHNSNVLAISFLSCILKAAFKEGIISQDPFKAGYIALVAEDTMPVFLNQKQRTKLMEYHDSLDKTTGSWRHLTWYLFGVFSGLRFSDWRKFNIEQHQDAKHIIIRAEKNKERVVLPIGDSLRKYIKLLKSAGPCKTQATFHFGMKVISRKCGLNLDLHPHSARHSFGYLCASLGIPKDVTASLMKVTTKTVEVYYHLTGEDIEKQAAPLRNI